MIFEIYIIIIIIIIISPVPSIASQTVAEQSVIGNK